VEKRGIKMRVPWRRGIPKGVQNRPPRLAKTLDDGQMIIAVQEKRIDGPMGGRQQRDGEQNQPAGAIPTLGRMH
jgi:hypothetical protein